MRRSILLFLSVAACVGKQTPDDSGTPRVGAPDELCHGFAATPLSWPVPNPDYVFAEMWDVGLGQSFSLIDIDGDGDPDLLTTREGVSDNFGGPGAYHWELRRNSGAGFGAMEPWSIPALDERDLVRAWEANEAYGLLDLNGDGTADLVRATDPTTGALPGGAGDPHWLFYAGGSSGFASEAARWALPAPVGSDDFLTLRSNTAYRSWRLADMDGDGLQDLVHASDPEGSGGPFADGGPHWRVYINAGNGFSTTPSRWALPANANPRQFGAWESTVGDQWTLLDLDLDGRADLIETTDPTSVSYAVFTDAAGFPYWVLHRNTGDGFDSAGEPWWIPDPSFDFLNSPLSWDNVQELHWRTLDMGGGGTPDLVIATDPDSEDQSQAFWDEAHGPQWAPFSYAQTGFAFQHEPWEVPDRAFHRFHYGDPAGRGSWETLDLTGDGCADLVVASVEGMDWPGYSRDSAWAWRVYPGE